MKKYIFTLLVLLFLPSLVLAANDLSFDADTNIYLSGSNITVVVESGSVVDSITVNPTSLDVVFSSGSSIRIKSNERRYLTNNLVSTICGDTYSYILLTSSTNQTVTVTPSSDICPVTAGSAAPSPTPVPEMPTTTTGQVTATASAGGKTSLTTPSALKAEVNVPVAAVSANTTVSVSSLAASAAPATPSGLSAVANQFVDITASSAGAAVTSFSKAITISFTYTASQVADINQDTLKIYRWTGSQWQALTSTVDKTNKIVTATTTNLSYFVLMGSPVSLEQPSLAEGTLIKSATEPAIYVLRGGKKLHISSWDAFVKAEYKIADVQTVTIAQIASYSDVTLFKVADDSKVYYIEKGKKRHIPTAAVFEGYGFKWNEIVTITAKERDGYIDVSLIKVADEPKVYLIQAGKKRHIPNASVFEDYGFKWNEIFVVSKDERDAYTDVKLVKTADKSAVYYLQDGKKELIASASAFVSRGFKWNEIFVVSAKELATYPNK